MVFNSIHFVLFFATFFSLYWFVFRQNLKIQNLLLLTGNYIFLAWWDWRFLLILVISSIVNFLLGIYIAKTENEKNQRFLLILGLIQGLGGLLFFKYYNFFVYSLADAFSLLNINLNIHTLHLILPLGISFYTFRAISYLLDVESGRIKPTKDWIIFFSYLSFFPSLLSGPIDRARNFIPQLEKKRIFDYNHAADGLRQILWGLFKKVVIADNCDTLVNQIFENPQAFSSSTLLLGAFFYTIQLYADFSGYSDMAIGISRLIGFNLTKNFNFPFFAQNISDFWQRWHISLTTWMTEYVFTPLSFIFRDYGKTGTILAIIINFVLVGLWHGANWTFILYGLLHGCYFIPLILRGTLNKKKHNTKDRLFPTAKELINIVMTFTLVMLTLVIFKSETIRDAYIYYSDLFSTSLFSIPTIPGKKINILFTLLFILIMFIIEWIERQGEYGFATLGLKWYRPIKWTMYYGLLFIIFYFTGKEQQFIYFQF